VLSRILICTRIYHKYNEDSTAEEADSNYDHDDDDDDDDDMFNSNMDNSNCPCLLLLAGQNLFHYNRG
jgi:hypothetical protein